ncbi:MAG TPA: SdpI family protein [Candidatus Eremiobacteraceae bacterium]|nr:SdpI family protein [Candidatus Eremiobacteraceae bacterium]
MSRKYYLIGIVLTALVAIATVAVYPRLPDFVPSHWNLHNQPNGYSHKYMLFVFGPGFMVGIMLLMRALPWLSPKNFEVDSFRSSYLQIMLMLVCMFAYFQGLLIWGALGHSMDVGRAIIGGACLLLALLGNLMGKIRRNFYIGIRTPWAIANERVWNATHRFAAKTLVIGGLIGVLLTAIGVDGWPLLALLLAAALIPAIYSLVFYKQLERRGEL